MLHIISALNKQLVWAGDFGLSIMYLQNEGWMCSSSSPWTLLLLHYLIICCGRHFFPKAWPGRGYRITREYNHLQTAFTHGRNQM